ncbi:MAG: hypothetical protein ABIO24_02585, partial [Saprospiraceae bacterium]
MNPWLKNLLSPFLLFLFMPLAWADLGNASVYHTVLKMKTGEEITCFLVIYGYEDYAYIENGTNAYCNAAGIMKVIKTSATNQRLLVYRKIYYPSSYRLKHSIGDEQLCMVLTADTFSIHSSEVKSARFLDAEAYRSFHPGLEEMRFVSPEILALAQKGYCFS